MTSNFEIEKTSNEHLLTISFTMGDVCVPEFESLNTVVYGGFITGSVYELPIVRESVLVKGRKIPWEFLKEKTKDSVDKIRQRFSIKFLGKYKSFPFRVKNDSIGISSNKTNKQESSNSNKEEPSLKPRMEAVIFEDKLKGKS